MKPLKFYLVTDTHYFKNSLGAYGKDYEAFMDFEQKCFAETQAINEAVFDTLAKAQEADIVLIAGDLSFNGEKESNEAFSKLLHDFQKKSGKRVYVVTADHGGHGTGHGGWTDEEKYVTFAAAGKSVRHAELPEMNIRDLAAIVLYALGLDRPALDEQGWTAQLPPGLFDDPAAEPYRDLSHLTGAAPRVSKTPHTSELI